MKQNIVNILCLYLMVWWAAAIVACDQTKADFPDMTGATGQCGPWYPGGGGDAGTEEYAVEIDQTFPCFVWESASTNGEDTWINVGQLYLEVEHGVSNAKAIVIPVIGTD